MKKIILLLVLVTTAIAGANAQSFIDRLPTVNTGIKGCFTTDIGFIKVYGHDDLTHPIKTGMSFDLLNVNSVKDDYSLNTLKIKVTYDPDGKLEGTIGYVYPSGTSLTDLFNYSTSRVEINFKNLLPTENTGMKGTVTYEGLTLRMNDFDDYSPNLANGTAIELLNTRMVKTIDCMGLCLAKVKVLDGPHAGKVGYVYASLTSFSSKADYTNLTIGGSGSSASTGTTFDPADYVNERTGISGSIIAINDTVNYAYGYEDGKDVFSEVHVPAGATFTLLNKKVLYVDETLDYYIKVRMTSGEYSNTIMWITIYNTSLSSRFNENDAVPMVK